MFWLDPPTTAEQSNHLTTLLNALATRAGNHCPVCARTFEEGGEWLGHLQGAHPTAEFERLIDVSVLRQEDFLSQTAL